ncbi:hypothetical protein DDQ50_15545 [Amnibacterium flavum]|uniref:D-inositol 3-phosphate glycosyltransferase n=1 Tax=Amnibacterium flavum TaxID=2173173 RepID=A0A2V1HTQ1_9MICO|nr:hypothetical protein DDQ50_15545 [Amnibacterium flavum]
MRHLAPIDPADRTVERLPDPDPDEPGRSAVSRWWPPAMLEPDWVDLNASFDVFHLQFGFDARSPEQLAALTGALERRERPFVYTVHDLRNPHHTDRAAHDAALDVLIPAADALITLTRGAADEIERRWNRTAEVIPHPHVVDFETMARIQAERAHSASARADSVRPFRIGVHLKSLRASVNPLPVLRALVDAVRDSPGLVLQVDGHNDVLHRDGRRYDAELADFVETAAARGLIDLRIHDYFSDEDLWRYLASLDASVLPYRFGTHSGWLEACRDLGTAVIAPDCGYYGQQGPAFIYGHSERGLDAESLIAAVAAARQAGPATPVSVAERMRQRTTIADRHRELYRSLLP